MTQFSARLQAGERKLLISILNSARIDGRCTPKVRDEIEMQDLEEEFIVLKQWCVITHKRDMDAFLTEWVRKDKAGIDFRLQFVVQCLTTHMELWDEHELQAIDSDLESSSACEEAGPDDEQEAREDENIDEDQKRDATRDDPGP